MKSLIAAELKLSYHPVAILFSNDRPEEARRFQEGKWGCVMAMYNLAMSKGETAVFDRKSYGCIGGGVGLCLGNTYKDNRGFMLHLLADEEGFFKDQGLVEDFLDNFDYVDIDYKYVVFKPLAMVDEAIEQPTLVSFPANADQLAALSALISFRRPGIDHVTADGRQDSGACVNRLAS